MLAGEGNQAGQCMMWICPAGQGAAVQSGVSVTHASQVGLGAQTVSHYRHALCLGFSTSPRGSGLASGLSFKGLWLSLLLLPAPITKTSKDQICSLCREAVFGERRTQQ